MYKQRNIFKKGLKVAREIGHREWISALLSSLGQTTRKQGHTNRQQYIYKKAYRLLNKSIGHKFSPKHWMHMAISILIGGR